jgi:hypothetical protein
MAESTPQDRRVAARTKLRTALRYQIRGTSDFNNAICDDISLAGIGFVNDEFLSPDTLVSLEINVFSKVICAVGMIAWSFRIPHSERFRTGIRFLEFDSVDKDYLIDYINMQLDQL